MNLFDNFNDEFWHNVSRVFTVWQLARYRVIFGLEFSKHFCNRPAATLVPWSYYIPIHSHLNYVKFLVSEFQVTGIASQYVRIHFFVSFESVDPCLKDLTIVNGGLTSFGERDDVIILKAKTARTVAETLADDVASGIFPPTVRVTARDSISFSPTQLLSLLIKEPWPYHILLIFFIILPLTCFLAHLLVLLLVILWTALGMWDFLKIGKLLLV